MKIVQLIREKRLELKAANEAFVKRIEPQIEEFQEAVKNAHITSRLRRSEIWPVQDRALPMRPKVVDMLKSLEPVRGEVIHVGDWVTIDQECITQFSHLTGDEQWIHLDQDKARKCSPFRTTVAQGFLVISLLPKMANFDSYQDTIYQGAKYFINCGLDKVEFLNPVKVNTKIRCRTIIKDIKPERRYLDVTQLMLIERAGDEKLVCRAEVLLRVFV